MKLSRLAVLALALAALLPSWLRARGEREDALAEVQKHGGTVVGFPFSISFDGKDVSDDDLVCLKKLPDLEGLYLRKCGKVTDKGMESLAGLTKMKYLFLNGTGVTDKGLAQLKGMQNLQTLSIQGTQVTDEGLKNLKDLRSLQVLETRNSKVTREGIAELKKSMPRLTVR